MPLTDSICDAFLLLLAGDAVLLRIVWISLKTSLLALAVAAPPAILVSYAVAMRRFPLRRAVIWLLQASLSIPTVLIGLLLYLALSRQGPLGGLQWLFTQAGIIFGQVLIVLPLLTAFSLSAIQAADPRLPETAVALGASRWGVMRTVLHEVRFGIMAAIISGFGRAISEVGCAIMIGGNIAGETRTMTTAIALETSKGEFAQGIALGIVLVGIALAINAVLVLLQGNPRGERGLS